MHIRLENTINAIINAHYPRNRFCTNSSFLAFSLINLYLMQAHKITSITYTSAVFLFDITENVFSTHHGDSFLKSVGSRWILVCGACHWNMQPTRCCTHFVKYMFLPWSMRNTHKHISSCIRGGGAKSCTCLLAYFEHSR